MTHYETLGVPRDADDATIKRAFRKVASSQHPDREGGDADKMARANLAYEVLADPERRKHYDETGLDRPGMTTQQEARQALLKVFAVVMDEEDGDWLAKVRECLAQARRQIEEQKTAVIARRGRLVKRRDKVRTKQDTENLLHMVIDQQVKGLAQQIELLERALVVQGLATGMLDAYESDPEAEVQPMWMRPTSFAMPGGAY